MVSQLIPPGAVFHPSQITAHEVRHPGFDSFEVDIHHAVPIALFKFMKCFKAGNARNVDENMQRAEVLDGRPFDDYGCVVVGEEGKLFFHRHDENWVINPTTAVDGFTWPAQSIPRATNEENYDEFYDAVVGNIVKCQSNFAHAGPFTETILLGVIAQRSPNKKLEWDSESMEIKGEPGLKKYIQRKYSRGWKLDLPLLARRG